MSRKPSPLAFHTPAAYLEKTPTETGEIRYSLQSLTVIDVLVIQRAVSQYLAQIRSLKLDTREGPINDGLTHAENSAELIWNVTNHPQ